uniref:Uncharacterized protein n=1 Tax=Schistocephalus solidus TaxID=70667 RepID=A0A0X3PD58_SCHSO
MTNLSVIMLFAVAHALVCQASPAYPILELEDEESGVMRMEVEENEAEENEEEEVRSSTESNTDEEQMKTELDGEVLAHASRRRRLSCIRVCLRRRCKIVCRMI